MKRSLAIEARGDGCPIVDGRAYVAEITGLDPTYGFARRFLRGNRDRSHSNRAGTRGVMAHYVLEEGPIYEVRTWVSRRVSVVRYIRYDGGEKQEYAREQVMEIFSEKA